MRRYIHAFAMCQSMFCAIPIPWKLWDEEARPLMLLFLPLIGLEIGAIWAGCAFLMELLGLPALVTGAVLCACPFVLTGFIHLDGFMDVSDAVGSCRDLDRRRAILKDPHVGSFAVIGCVLLMVAQLAVLSSVREGAAHGVLMLIPVVSRCGSALAVTLLPPMSTSQYAAQQRNIAQGWILTGMLALAVAAGFLCFGKYGFALVGCVAGYAWALRRGYTSLGGMNGDISGYALTIAELCGAAVYALI